MLVTIKEREVEGFYYPGFISTPPPNIPAWLFQHIVKVSKQSILLLVKEADKNYILRLPENHWIIKDGDQLYITKSI